MKKVISLVCVALSLLFVLAACSPTPTMDELNGVYEADYVYNGNQFYRILTISADGTFVESSSQANGNVSSQYGTIEIDGSEVRLKFSTGGYSAYDYSDGNLEGSNYTYVKR